MALRIRTVLTYPLDGSTEFIIPFEYLARKFVTVTLIGQDRKELVLNQDFRFVAKTKIQTSRTWTSNEGYTFIEIRRFTSATERLVDFADGSILRAYDLNISQVQTLHVAEEARDLTADTIGVNNDGNLDARGRRIVNVADGREPGDAINLGQVQRWNNSALNSANAAKTSETNAKTSEINSKTSENAAHKWAQNPEDDAVVGSEYSAYHYSRKASNSSAASEASAVRSDSSAANSTNSAAKALTSETNAKTSENNAKTSETNAKASADKAEVEAAKLGNMNEFAASLKEVVAPIGSTQGKIEFKPEYMLEVKKATASEVFAAPLFAGLDDTTGNLSFTTDAIVFTQGARWWSFSQNGEFSIAGGFRIAPDGDIMGPRWGNVWLTDYMDARFVNDVWLGGQEWVATNGVGRYDHVLSGSSVCTGYTQDATGGLWNAWLDGMFHRKLWIRYGNGQARIISST